MASWQQGLTDVMTVELVVLMALAVWQWHRYRARGSGWAVGAFTLLAAAAVVSYLLPKFGVSLPPLWVLKGLLIALLLVPFALYRFAASFVPVRRSAQHVAAGLTAAVVTSTVLLPYIPFPGQAPPWGYFEYRILIALQWGLLFGFVAVRMWRAGTHQPHAARNRMRLLAIAATGLDLPVIISVLSLSNKPWVQMMGLISTVVMAVLFALGLVLPSVVRSWWRNSDRNAMQVAFADLVRAYSVEDIAGGLLPHVAALTGAADITLVDASGTAVARYRAARIPAQRESDDGTASGMVPIEVPVGGAYRLLVRSDPYLPFFARDEFRTLTALGEFVGLAIDRCELFEREREAQAELAHQAMHDSLTGLPNRAFFTERLTEALARTQRQSSALAVMFIDLDRFKLVNDGIDHAAGDEVLAETARRLLATARAGDMVSRFGGDEFTVLAEVHTEDEALNLADRLRTAISAPILIGARELSVGASIGVVMTDGGDDPVAMVRDADAAMYRAKEGGRDRVVLFGSQIRRQALHRLDIESELRHALVHGEIGAVYQPIVDLRSGAVTGIEALARWDHPSRGRLTPDEFLGVAEDTHLIIPLGEQILTLACEHARHWASIADSKFKVWVNVSARQFADPGLRDTVMRIVGDAGVAPSMLGIEITESVLMAGTDLVAEQLEQMRSCGVSIAIDDFGTGFSSLGYLARFPVDRLKIDRSFVVGIGTEPSTSLLTACLAMGDSLGLTTVAEGVETLEQAEWLTEAGCDAAQGYHYARPLNAHQISNLLRHGLRFGKAEVATQLS